MSQHQSQASLHTSSQPGRVRTPPLESRRLPRSAGGGLVALLGVSLLGAGVAIVIGPRHVPELEPWVARATEFGLRPDVLGACGLVLLCMAFLSGTRRGEARVQLQPGLAVSYLEDLCADVSILQNLLREQSGNSIEQGVQLSNLHKELLEHRQEVASSNPKDALFRLAASLDQLGARIDARIGETLTAVQEATFSMSGAVESARDSVLDSVESSSQHIEEMVYDMAQSLTGAGEDYVEPVAPAERPAYRLVEDPEEEDDEGLTISVELEPADQAVLDTVLEGAAPCLEEPGLDLGLMEQLDESFARVEEGLGETSLAPDEAGESTPKTDEPGADAGLSLRAPLPPPPSLELDDDGPQAETA